MAPLIVIGVLAAGLAGWYQVAGNEPGAHLLARVPAELRGDCSQLANPATIAASATLKCQGAGGQEVLVSLFATSSDVDTAYGEIVRQAGVARGSGDCGIATGAEHRYPGVAAPRGRALCYRQGDNAFMVWTDDAMRTVAGASRADGNDYELYRFWAALFDVPSFPTADEQELLDLVAQTDCKRAPAGSLDPFPGVVAAIDCVAADSGANTVSFYRFAELEALRRSYNAHVSRSGAPTGGPACEDGEAPGFLVENRWNLRTVALGRLLCYSQPKGELVMEWTVEPVHVLAHAVGTDPKALGEWWSDNSGVQTDQVVKAANLQAKPRFPTPQEQALLSRIPAASRVNCMRPSAERVSEDVLVIPIAGIVCTTSNGPGRVFYYQLPDAASMADSYSNYAQAGPDCASATAEFTGEAPYSNGAATGRLACSRLNSGTPYLMWTNDQLNILAYAETDDDPAAMLDWWRAEAGPV